MSSCFYGDSSHAGSDSAFVLVIREESMVRFGGSPVAFVVKYLFLSLIFDPALLFLILT